MKRPDNVRYTNQFYRPRRVNNNGLYVLFAVTSLLVVVTIILAVAAVKKSKKYKSSIKSKVTKKTVSR